MIIEIKKYAKEEVLILVSEIVMVYYKEDVSIDNNKHGLSATQYQFEITFKDRNKEKFWYNGDKETCLTEYNKVKEALLLMYRKDTIKDELHKYLKELQKD